MESCSGFLFYPFGFILLLSGTLIFTTVIEAPIFGLILAGGESSRMGENKAQLIYHDRPQWAYASQLISPYCRNVYFSLKYEEQIPDIDPSQVLIDHSLGMGAVSGLLAAFEREPDAAWLVLGVNMPGVDRALINRVFRQRNPERDATCLMVDGRPEALLSIWEPACGSKLKEYAHRGKNSLRKFLEEQQLQAVELDSSMSFKLDSIDTPEERQNFLRKGRK